MALVLLLHDFFGEETEPLRLSDVGLAGLQSGLFPSNRYLFPIGLYLQLAGEIIHPVLLEAVEALAIPTQADIAVSALLKQFFQVGVQQIGKLLQAIVLIGTRLLVESGFLCFNICKDMRVEPEIGICLATLGKFVWCSTRAEQRQNNNI